MFSLSYLLFLVGFPVTYWFCVHKLGEENRYLATEDFGSIIAIVSNFYSITIVASSTSTTRREYVIQLIANMVFVQIATRQCFGSSPVFVLFRSGSSMKPDYGSGSEHWT